MSVCFTLNFNQNITACNAWLEWNWHFCTQSVSSFSSTCPYHRNLFCCSINIISSSPSLSLNSLLGTLSFALTIHIQLTILMSASWSATSFSFLTGQVSLPCSILLRTQLLYSQCYIDDHISFTLSSTHLRQYLVTKTDCLPGSKYGTKIVKNTVELLLQLSEDTRGLGIQLQNISLSYTSQVSFPVHISTQTTGASSSYILHLLKKRKSYTSYNFYVS